MGRFEINVRKQNRSLGWKKRFSALALALLMGLGAGLGQGVLSPQSAYALTGFSPQSYQTNINYGEGVYFAPYRLEIRETPSETAPIVETITWNHGSGLSIFSEMRKTPLDSRNIFVCFYPHLDIAMMAVNSENGEGWAEVIYDQARKKTGWVKISTKAAKQEQAASGEPEHFGNFQSWLQFMRLNARHNGIYWLSGVGEYHRNIRSKPEDGSPFLETTFVKSYKVVHARGNWLLVEGRDFGGGTPVGWVRWRDDDGRLMVFTDFTKTRQILTSPF